MMDLAEHYPWPSGPWLRVMNAMTLDGSATGPDGRSGSLSGPADRAVLAEVRRLADAVLIGGATLRQERYRPLRAADPAGRAAAGRSPVPVLVVVSGSLDLPWQEPVFHESIRPPLVITSESADRARLDKARGCCVVEVLPTVAMREVVALLRAHGLDRVVCEAGPRIVAPLIHDDLVDELDITFVPVIAGAASPAGGPAGDRRWSLVDYRLTDGFVFARYLRDRRVSLPE